MRALISWCGDHWGSWGGVQPVSGVDTLQGLMASAPDTNLASHISDIWDSSLKIQFSDVFKLLCFQIQDAVDINVVCPYLVFHSQAFVNFKFCPIFERWMYNPIFLDAVQIWEMFQLLTVTVWCQPWMTINHHLYVSTYDYSPAFVWARQNNAASWSAFSVKYEGREHFSACAPLW